MNSTFFAKYISYIFIPPFLNLAILTIFSLKLEEYPNNLLSIINSLVLAVILPITIFHKLRKKGKIVNNDAIIKEERYIPYIYGIFLTLIALLISALFQFHIYTRMLWMVYLICSILLININHYWKISAHTMGAAIPLGAGLIFNSTFTFTFLIVLLLAGLSRLILKVHTTWQIIAGGIVGFLVSFFLINYLI